YIEEAQNKIAYKEELNKALAKLQIYKNQVQQVLVIRKDVDLKEKELKETRNKYTVLTKEISIRKQEEESITKEHNALFEAWLQNQAGEIAKILEHDKPCPVCGSISHPQKAKITYENVDLEEIRKKEADKLRINGAIRQKEEEQNNIKELGIRLRTEQEQLKARAVELIAEYDQITVETQQGIEVQVKKLEEQIEQINKDQEKMQAYKVKVVNLEEERVALENQNKEKQIYLGQLNSKIEEVQKELPGELQSKDALSSKLISIQNEYKQLEKHCEESGKDLELVRSEQTKNGVSLQEKQNTKDQLAAQKVQKNTLFEEALKQSQLESVEQYRESKIYVGEIEHTKQRIESYLTNQAVLENSLKELEAKIKDFKVEELENVKIKYNEVFNQKEEEQNKWNKINVYMDKHQIIRKQMEELYVTSMEIIRKQSVIGSVASLAKGKNSKGLSFERYIQSSIFEQVLRSANNKLKPMTGSRYELQRTEDRQDRRKQSGLDITVKDNYVGQTRPVNTLSGGESFMAALALALGLSEVIQRLAGATSLDTMFIDEGFGTLDEEALDLAIKTLLNLGNTGRLVGIISHVKELREQIPARLEIIATNTGSRAEFKI
ncbi:MAG: SbcC/MukB-like Walker B domain-containing protein, partial [Cellulosilyticaceae bacterium]